MFPRQLGFSGMVESLKNKTLLSEVRLNSLYNVGLYCSNLDGDFVELGCHWGGTSFLLASILKPPHKIYSFDSFEGLPKSVEQDGYILQECYLKSDYEWTKKYLSAHNERDDVYSKVEIYKGWVEDTLINIKDIPLSLVYIDMDLYASTKFAMNMLWSQLVSGGFMVFDDYQWGSTPGVKKAVDEFFGDLFGYDHYYIECQLGVAKR
jgi:O-methyltransferase